jgi:hypothetical protein
LPDEVVGEISEYPLVAWLDLILESSIYGWLIEVVLADELE